MIQSARTAMALADPVRTGFVVPGAAGQQAARPPWRHPIPSDVVLERGFITVRADLPGIPGQNIEVVVTPRYVEIIGWPPEPSMPAGYVLSERQHEVVRRTLRLPEEVIAGRSVARLSGGVLEVRIPRPPLSSGWAGKEREA